MSELKRYDGFLNSNMQLEFTEFEDGRYVKYSDIEKMEKLWDMQKPKVLDCNLCQHGNYDIICGLFGGCCLDRCQQCIDIFGGDV